MASDARQFPLFALLIGPIGNLLATATRLLPFTNGASAVFGFKLLREFFQLFQKALHGALRTAVTLTFQLINLAHQSFNLLLEVVRATGWLTRI